LRVPNTVTRGGLGDLGTLHDSLTGGGEGMRLHSAPGTVGWSQIDPSPILAQIESPTGNRSTSLLSSFSAFRIRSVRLFILQPFQLFLVTTHNESWSRPHQGTTPHRSGCGGPVACALGFPRPS